MNILAKLIYRIRAIRIDLLRADITDIERLIYALERKQHASQKIRRSRRGVTRTRVPEFLRKGTKP